MKLIIAIIRPYHLELLQSALQRQTLSLTSISEVLGGNPEAGYELIYRGRVVNARRPKCRIELMVEDYQADDAVAIIRAHTTAGCPGNVSDARIMMLQLEELAPVRRSVSAVRREELPHAALTPRRTAETGNLEKV